jgi:hypothetical protein
MDRDAMIAKRARALGAATALALPVPAFAHGLSLEVVVIGIALLVLPFALSIAIAPPGFRLKFLAGALVTYAVAFGISYTVGSLLIGLLATWILIPAAVAARVWRSKSANN